MRKKARRRAVLWWAWLGGSVLLGAGGLLGFPWEGVGLGVVLLFVFVV